jgi:hypothetical protein
LEDNATIVKPRTAQQLIGCRRSEAEPHQVSASGLNRQLTHPVTSLRSLTFQFNSYRIR